ncbi:MAG TPA: TraR/DksA C4-type zinc finger protein [Pirellulaceae bacterium]|jgi:transcription elongation factor Elf1|nr:TraR/DksA C4-type zinc finger protein [Pirellulaceae bacterium]
MDLLTWHCPACRFTEPSDRQALIARLQSAGLLKRASKEELQDFAYLLALANTATNRWNCPGCGAAGYSVAAADDFADEFAAAKECSACGQRIPPERLELFPDATLCVDCQSAIDRGSAPDTQEFCPRCGSRMQVRAARGAGVARYALVCPQCRR